MYGLQKLQQGDTKCDKRGNIHKSILSLSQTMTIVVSNFRHGKVYANNKLVPVKLISPKMIA